MPQQRFQDLDRLCLSPFTFLRKSLICVRRFLHCFSSSPVIVNCTDDPEKRFLQVGVRARHQQLVKTSRVAARHFQGQLVLQVEMESEMFAPAEGQAVSFYLGDVCVAGGAIGLVLDRHQHLLDAPVDLSAFEEASAICNDGINHS
mmetsp:Transcript_38781/g.62133  ORF Transcript_38781/g.62133 Transcript_38781/m.62133 type:complete len:146 (-) Transcript_38781:259-696(-)